MLNEVRLIGRLGREPEVRQLQGGDKVANFSVATSENWKDKQTGEWRERTEWHNCVCWKPYFVDRLERMPKGTLVHIAGKMQTRQWEDQGGNKRYSTEVVITKIEGRVIKLAEPGGGSSAPAQSQPPADMGSEMDDEIPF